MGLRLQQQLHLLGITQLSTCRQYLKLALLYKAAKGQTYFPPGIFSFFSLRTKFVISGYQK